MSDELKVKAQRLGQLLANSTKIDLDEKMKVLGLLKDLTESKIDEIVNCLEEKEGCRDLNSILAI